MAIHALEKMTHAAIAKLDPARTMVIVPISPLEVHGPHLPLGQDLFEATTLMTDTAAAVARRRDDWDFLLHPPIPVATDCVPALGSVSYPVSVVRQVAYHALLPFARKGFARLAYASFHGGPRHFLALEDAAERLNKRHGVAAISLFSAAVARLVEGTAIFDGVRDVKGRQVEIDQIRRDHHAGFIETSIALHRWPELVAKGWKDLPPSISDPEGKDAKRNNAFYYGYAAKAGLTERAARAVARVKSIARALAHFRANTYSGYPALASAAEGKALLAHLVEMSAGIVEEFLERGAEMDGHSPLWPAKGFFLSPATNKVADDWLKIYAQ